MKTSTKIRWIDTLGFGGAFFIAGLVSLYLSAVPHVITPLWVANILGMALLIRHSPRHWIIPLVGISIANMLAFVVFGNGWLLSSYLTIINLVEMTVTALIINQYNLKEHFDNQITSAMILMVTTALFSPGIRILTGILLVGVNAPSFTWADWFVGDGIGMITLLPVALCLLTHPRYEVTLKECIHALLWFLLTTALVLLTLIYLPYAYIMVLIPLLLLPRFLSTFISTLLISATIFLIFTLYNVGIYHPLLSTIFHKSYFMYLPNILLYSIAYLFAVFLSILKKSQEALIANEKHLYEEKEHMRLILTGMIDGVITTNPQGLITYLNPTAEKITGWKLNKARGLSYDRIFTLVKTSNVPLKNPLTDFLANPNKSVIKEDALLINKMGAEFNIIYTTTPLVNQAKEMIGLEIIFQNLTETKNIQKELLYNATHDPLTGLLNRREFDKALSDAQQEVNLNGAPYILCYLDLDNFKIVNDSLGHSAGDALLQEIAGLLQQRLRKGDILARLGGDEFGILLAHCSHETGKRVVQEIIDLVNALRFPWKNKIYRIGVSIGIVVMSDKMLSTNQLLSEADVACYAAKAAGRNQAIVYKTEPNESIEYHRKILLVSTLQEAIDQNRLVLYVQKIIPINPNLPQATHFEILLRMLDEESNIITAAQFIQTAEQFNLMLNIDQWILTQLLTNYDKQLMQIPNSTFSINLSGNSLNDPGFLNFLLTLIKKSALPPEHLCFEITETATMSQISKTTFFITKLQEIGCQIALDDFGVGLSSFSYIRNFPVNFIKIDGSFIRKIVDNKLDRSIVQTINILAHELGMQTIAEYVENKAILQAIKEIGIDYAQGFAIDKPVSLESILSDSVD